MTYKALMSFGDICVGRVGSHLTNGPSWRRPHHICIYLVRIWPNFSYIISYFIQKKNHIVCNNKKLICGVRVPWHSFVSSRTSPCHNVYYATTCAIIHVLGHVPLYRNHRFPGAWYPFIDNRNRSRYTDLTFIVWEWDEKTLFNVRYVDFIQQKNSPNRGQIKERMSDSWSPIMHQKLSTNPMSNLNHAIKRLILCSTLVGTREMNLEHISFKLVYITIRTDFFLAYQRFMLFLSWVESRF